MLPPDPDIAGAPDQPKSSPSNSKSSALCRAVVIRKGKAPAKVRFSRAFLSVSREKPPGPKAEAGGRISFRSESLPAAFLSTSRSSRRGESTGFFYPEDRLSEGNLIPSFRIGPVLPETKGERERIFSRRKLGEIR